MEKRIRSVEIKDAEAVRDIYAPSVLQSATSFEIEPPDVTIMEQRIRKVQEQYPWLVFEADGRVLGYAYASRYREREAYQWCIEVSAYVHASAHRCGVGRALYASLFEIVRRQGYVNAYAAITLPNPSSVGLHRSMGFDPVGVFTRMGYKFEQWHDVIWLQRRLIHDPAPVPKPLAANQILGMPEIDAIFQRDAQTVRMG